MATIARIQNRRDTAANWTSQNPVLASGEIGLETDTRLHKIGDGSTTWTALPYGGLAGSLPAGTSFPATATVGLFFYRTDLKASFIYNGTAWDQLGGGGIESFLLMGA